MARWIAILLKAAKAINAVTATLCVLVVGVGLVVSVTVATLTCVHT